MKGSCRVVSLSHITARWTLGEGGIVGGIVGVKLDVIEGYNRLGAARCGYVGRCVGSVTGGRGITIVMTAVVESIDTLT